jgi:predicted deacetylase
MIPTPAQYLLRIDDLCPTVCAERWQQFQSLIEDFQLHPILAVVPDNQDPELKISPPNPVFWDSMRALEAAGAAIGLHGYRHVCASRGRSLVALHRVSEFAGVPAATQQAWIGDGMRILRGHGLDPNIWIAPRHGFDRNTLTALREEGILHLSDGFARVPFLRSGLTWIPQQLWAPVEKDRGLWTVCVHPNTASDAEIVALRSFLDLHAGQFTSLDRVLFRFEPAALNLAERIHAVCTLRRLKISHTGRRWCGAALFHSMRLA